MIVMIVILISENDRGWKWVLVEGIGGRMDGGEGINGGLEILGGGRCNVWVWVWVWCGVVGFPVVADSVVNESTDLSSTIKSNTFIYILINLFLKY